MPETSNCTPGEGDLTDGIWFGYVTAAADTAFELDLACWFSGDAAVEAAAADGEESPPPNDYYVRNENNLSRRLTPAQNLQVTWYESGDPFSDQVGDYAAWIERRTVIHQEMGIAEFPFGVWITLVAGEVTELTEMWVP